MIKFQKRVSILTSEVEQLKQSIISAPEKLEMTRKQGPRQGFAFSHYFTRIQLLQVNFCVLLVLQMLSMHLYFELDLAGNAYASTFNSITFIIGLIMVMGMILRKKFEQGYGYMEEGLLDNVDSIIVKVILLLIMPYPFLGDIEIQLQYSDADFKEVPYQFKLNYILIMLTIFRTCYFASSFLVKSKYISPRANRICGLYGAKPGVIFCLRAIFKDSPFSFISTIFLLSVFVFAFLFRIAEYQIYHVSSFTMYSDMAWMTIITMTSVGYGDYSPKTPLGRIMGALCVSWGVLIVSVMVVVMTNAFSMNRSQSQSLNILKNLQKNIHLREVAGRYIRESVWRIWKNYKYSLNRKTKMKERKLMVQFRKYRRERDMANISQSEIDFYNEMVRQFERAFINLQNLTANNLKIINYLNEEYIFKDGLTDQAQSLLHP